MGNNNMKEYGTNNPVLICLCKELKGYGLNARIEEENDQVARVVYGISNVSMSCPELSDFVYKADYLKNCMDKVVKLMYGAYMRYIGVFGGQNEI